MASKYLSLEHRYQKLATLRIHDASFSHEEVLFNRDRFNDLPTGDGLLAQIIPFKAGVTTKEIKKGLKEDESASLDPSSYGLHDRNGSVIGQNEADTEQWRAYTFVVKDVPRETKDKDPNLLISVSSAVATVFDYRTGMQVVIQLADHDECVASHVELTFRDEYLSRGDMWRVATSELSERTLYKDQKLLFLGTIKATVKNIYIHGRSKMSGYFATDTRPVFRSESARYTVFIQMSREMWEFDTESSGEIMFNKVIHGFLPELFKKWMSINAHHLVSIILFARLEYENEGFQSDITEGAQQQSFGRPNGYQDFYRVVVSDMASNDWINILENLKREFLGFLQEISVQRQQTEDGEKFVVAGKLSEAYKGNLLEAICLASSQFSRDYIDRDLTRTGLSIMVITAGTGYFEVNYDLLQLTTDLLMRSGIGIDLVCLSPMPLHSVPLCTYRIPRVLASTVPTQAPSPSQSFIDNTPRQNELHLRRMMSASLGKSQAEPKAGEWSYAMPHWVDVSYWKGEINEAAMQSKRLKKSNRLMLRRPEDAAYQPRVRLYNLQMSGLMENELSSISIPKMHMNPLHPWHQIQHQISGKAVSSDTERRIGEFEQEWMNEYDDYIFRQPKEKTAIEEAARRRVRKIAEDSGRPLVDARAHRDDMDEGIPHAQSGSHRPGAGFLDWKIKDSIEAYPSTPAQRKASSASLMTTATTDTLAVRSPPIRIFRQISFTKPTVSTDLSVAGVAKTTPTAKSSQDESKAGTTFSSRFTQQFKAALSRSSTAATPTNAVPETVHEDSQETTRPIEIGAPTATTPAKLRIQHNRQISDEVLPSSVDTIKGSAYGGIRDRLSREYSRDEKRVGLAHLRRNIPYLSSSAETPHIPTTVSLTRALSPWLNMLNPCNSRKEDLNSKDQFTRWQHVFPKSRRADTVKWKSLCCPASVPLTNEYFPTADQLAKEYHENFYHLIQESEQDAAESREHLVRELIAFRLAHGFQLVVGDSVAEFLGNKKKDLAQVFDKRYMAQDGATIFMSVGNVIHQLLCGADNKVEIRRFNRKPTEDYEPSQGSNAVMYQPLIKTILAKGYEQRHITFKKNPSEHNWNMIDNFIAGFTDDFSDALRFWRARFVLIPVDIPSRLRQLSTVREDTDEEIRLDGIRRLTQLWQRNRVLPEDERLAQSLNRRKDPNPLAIEYQTRDPSAVIAAGIDSTLFTDVEAQLSPLMETHTMKSFDLKGLAEELQGENGVKMMDRRWHWRLHYNCFVGLDMTNWLLLKFKDIETRETAVDFGNKLMKDGLFVHVRSERDFRDGQYFYQMANDYRAPRPESKKGWFSTNRPGLTSVPATPMLEMAKTANIFNRWEETPRPDTAQSEDSGSSSKPERRKIYLSKVMRYDVDPRHRSYRPEIINLHYDRLHNPDNCYHIRIDWMNVTSKFIDDAVVYWATTVERYGLKLVEVPIAEAAAITDEHPFRAPYYVKLAKAPPLASITRIFDSTSFTPIKRMDKLLYHKAILKKLNFVLDVESATSFPTSQEVLYSWGAPDYKYTQYIHKTGVIIAQITEDGEFLLLANRLCNDRGSSRREGARLNLLERDYERRLVGHHGGNRRSPMASPAFKALAEIKHNVTDFANAEKGKIATPEGVKDEVERFCSDVQALTAFYAQVEKLSDTASPSPLVHATVPEMQVPSKSRGLMIDVVEK